MQFLIPITLTTVAITFAIVSGRSAALPPSLSRKADFNNNVVLLEIPASSGEATGKTGKVDGDKALLKGKNLVNLKEGVNAINEDRKIKSDAVSETTEGFSIIVPVARNFSSLKELFEILREDDAGSKGKKNGGSKTYVKGSEAKESDYTLFFTR